MPWMTVGALAKATGVTVRALHHYDEIGLLTPAHRSVAGYRMYGPAEVLRLSQIVCLRQLGLPLEEIQRSLDGPQASLSETLATHIEQLQAQIQEQQQLLTRLQAIAQQVDATGELSVQAMTQLMETIKMMEKYYSSEQREQLAARFASIPKERIEEVQQAWEALFAAFAQAEAQGTDPASEEVQALVAQSNALIREFTGGDPGIARSLQQMYQSEGPNKILQPHGYNVDPDVFAYMQRAREASPKA